MNLPTKLTIIRLILSVVIIFILVFPFASCGIMIPKYMIGNIMIEPQYFVAGVIFIIASITDFLDGYIARKYDMVTNTGKMLDAIADKALVNPCLIILACNGFISSIVPIVVILRDTIVNAIKMEAASRGVVVAAIKSGKLKTATLMVGIALAFFYNLPFEFINIRVADILLYLATIFSIISAIQYFTMNKDLIFGSDEKK